MPDFDLESWIESAAGGARNPGNWMGRAEELKRAFDLLHAKWREEDVAFIRAEFEKVGRGELTGPSPWLGSVAMLLAGLAIENVLKGILIARDPDLVQPCMKDPDRLIDWNRGGMICLVSPATRRSSSAKAMIPSRPPGGVRELGGPLPPEPQGLCHETAGGGRIGGRFVHR